MSQRYKLPEMSLNSDAEHVRDKDQIPNDYSGDNPRYRSYTDMQGQKAHFDVIH